MTTSTCQKWFKNDKKQFDNFGFEFEKFSLSDILIRPLQKTSDCFNLFETWKNGIRGNLSAVLSIGRSPITLLGQWLWRSWESGRFQTKDPRFESIHRQILILGTFN